MDQSQNLSEKNKSLQTENRRLRERLMELYVQINTLNAISDDLGMKASLSSETLKYRRLSSAAANPFRFAQTESLIIPGGAIYSASMSPKDENIALASLSGSITIMTSDLKTSFVLPGHSLACRDVHWSNIGLVSCGFDKLIKIWDVHSGTSQDFETNGLAHSVCGNADDLNTIFAASGDKIYWIDKRRDTPVTIPSDSPTTAVTLFKDYIIFGGYDGFINIFDKRNLQSGRIAHIDLAGGPISSLSRVLDSGRCIASTVTSPHKMLIIGNEVNQVDLKNDAPGRFGCRASINDKSLLFEGNHATVCGGKTAVFCDGAAGCVPQMLEDVGGFIYGALFMNDISQKILTYSEDGVVSVWSLHRF
ncbi:WD repeat-containing protein 5B isoform X2 [Histomonas meleagridis]|uniref:WD repeat-containing protein 5B isoform X2 n=1 Tax=Histomonas meleagridis TaxID=135588 RepID=UPI0035594A9E|nr:WD repeat-containing protein 5B isoform X2 [Histomonas meleagridis]KAH0796931.1 WD repeat-containing protein 5B isoform X2 [Histomonas meleagridis]